MLVSPVTRFSGITTIRRFRTLPVPGKIVVRKGQKVNGSDVIAETRLAPEHLLLDVARGLGLPSGKVESYVQRQVGEEVSEGDVIAGPVGLARRLVRAPRSGRIILIGSGQVLLELESRPFELKAGFPGTVSELVDGRGAEVVTTGALLQGVWGNGRIDMGLLNVLARSADDMLTPDRFDVSHRGSVVVGGTLNDVSVLEAAAELPLKGLVLASMDGRLCATAEKMRYPIILVEGFGRMPFNSPAYKLLSTNDRREIALNAEAWDRLTGTRPEMVIPLPVTGAVPVLADNELLGPGKIVRVVSASQKGSVGTLVMLRPGLTAFPGGVKAYAADIRLEGGENVVVPLANLEVLE